MFGVFTPWTSSNYDFMISSFSELFQLLSNFSWQIVDSVVTCIAECQTIKCCQKSSSQCTVAQCHNSINFEVWQKKSYLFSWHCWCCCQIWDPVLAAAKLAFIICSWGLSKWGNQSSSTWKVFWHNFLVWFYEYDSSLCQNICENFFGQGFKNRVAKPGQREKICFAQSCFGQ